MLERATNFVDFGRWQEKVGFWPIDEFIIIHDNICSLIRKCHPKRYHSDIEYYITLDIVLSLVESQQSNISNILQNGQCLHLGVYGFLQKHLAAKKFLILKYFNVSIAPLDALKIHGHIGILSIEYIVKRHALKHFQLFLAFFFIK